MAPPPAASHLPQQQLNREVARWGVTCGAPWSSRPLTPDPKLGCCPVPSKAAQIAPEMKDQGQASVDWLLGWQRRGGRPWSVLRPLGAAPGPQQHTGSKPGFATWLLRELHQLCPVSSSVTMRIIQAFTLVVVRLQ